MIEHLVLFKLKAGTAPAVADTIVATFRGLKSKIPSVVDLTCGRNFSERAQGFELGLTVRFKDKAGLDAYAVDPQHVAVVTTLIKPNAESVLALDYEI